MIEAFEKTEELKPYTLRKLCADDIFPFCSIINMIGFKEIKACFEKPEMKDMILKATEESTDAKTIGFALAMDIAGILLENIEKCKVPLYKLLSNLSGMTEEEIARLELDVFTSMIIDVIQKEEFKSFFKLASRLFK